MIIDYQTLCQDLVEGEVVDLSKYRTDHPSKQQPTKIRRKPAETFDPEVIAHHQSTLDISKVFHGNSRAPVGEVLAVMNKVPPGHLRAKVLTQLAYNLYRTVGHRRPETMKTMLGFYVKTAIEQGLDPSWVDDVEDFTPPPASEILGKKATDQS